MSPTGASSAHTWLARLGLQVRVGEGGLFTLLFGAHFLLLAFQYTAKSVRQSTFIDVLGAENLPWAYLLVAVASYPLLLLFGRLSARHDLSRVLTVASLVAAVSLLAFAWIFLVFPHASWPTLVFYLWTAVVGVLLVSQFWSYAAARLDARQARRLFAPVGAGGILGSIAGGQLARLGTLGPERWHGWGAQGALILGAGVLVLLAAVLTLSRRGPSLAAPEPPRLDPRAGKNLVRRSRYVQLISAATLLSALVAQVVDLQFAWVLEERTQDLAERTAAYGNLYSVMGSAALIFQVLFTARIHRRLGIGVALKVPPVSNGLGAAAFLLAAMLAPAFLWPVVWLLKLSENGLRYSLEQVTRELLFVPVPEHARPRAKVIVDVVVQRAAKGLAAAVLLSVTFGWLSVPQTAWIALVSVALWLWVLREIQERYVDSFRQGLLRRHRSSAGGEQLDLRDGATLEVLIGGLGSLDAKEVCHSLDLLAAHGRGHLVPPALLTHPESQVRLRTLEILRQVGHGRATPWVERLLADPDPPVRAAAFRALASLVPESLVMEMEERLYDSDPRVRAVAAAYLAANADPGPKEKADASLEAMIEDADGSVREEAARALGELDDPRFQAALVRLLYDPNPDVVRAAIGAVAERTSRGRASPLYVPILVSHLHRRNLKHEARDTLVAYGEGVIPALQHFLFDVNEQIWVRRALPRTIARIGGPAARLALTDALGARDPFQRRKVIEALQDLRSDSARDAPGGNVAGVVEQLSAGGAAPGGWSELDARVVENVIAAESRQCLELLLDLWGLEAYAAADDDGGGGISAASTARDSLPWISPRAGGAMGREVSGRGAPLLTRLLADRLLSHRANVFGLLSLLHSEREMAAARRGLESGRPELRAHALEYLDNVLQGEVRQQVFAVIDELPRADRLREARRLFGLVPETAETVLRRLALERPPGDYDAPWLTAAALRLIYDARIEALYPLLRRSAERDPEPLVQETAAHLIAQLKAEGLLPGP